MACGGPTAQPRSGWVCFLTVTTIIAIGPEIIEWAFGNLNDPWTYLISFGLCAAAPAMWGLFWLGRRLCDAWLAQPGE